MKKLNIDFVKIAFEDKGWSLLSTEYLGSQKPLKVICPNGHESKITWNNFQREQGCALCAGNAKYSYEEVKTIFEKACCELLSKQYVNNYELLTYRCSCGNVSKIAFRDFRIGVRCGKCKGSRISEKIRTPGKEISKLCDTYGFRLIEIMPNYRHTRIKYKCVKCDTPFESYWYNFKHFHSCRSCRKLTNSNPVANKSNPSPSADVKLIYQDFQEWARSFNRDGWSVELVDVDRLNDAPILQRYKHLESIGVNSFFIFPHEWELRSVHIKSHFESYQQQSRRIFARKCTVQPISKYILRDFCDNYHIQGKNLLAIQGWGIYYADELLGVLSLGRHNRQNKKGDEVVLDRLCFKSGVRVIGGADKLFTMAKNWAAKSGCQAILSFSDNRWSTGGVYEKLGFTIDANLPPDYFYLDNSSPVIYYSKQSQKKSNSGCPDNVTELEWSKAQGLRRVWDCGKKRWIFFLTAESIRVPLSCRRRHYHFSPKAERWIYCQSSYELRAAILLDDDKSVEFYQNQLDFCVDGRNRRIDFLVRMLNGRQKIVEVKPMRRLEEFKQQIEDNAIYAKSQGWDFEVWTETELGFTSEHYITKWADEYISEHSDNNVVDLKKEMRRSSAKKHYDEHIANDKVEVLCEFCKESHFPLRATYEKNIARNGRYICEAEGGHISGSKPKITLRKENPYASEGKKECNRCHNVKLFDNFSPDPSRRDGFCSRCKECRTEVATARYKLKNRRQSD